MPTITITAHSVEPEPAPQLSIPGCSKADWFWLQGLFGVSIERSAAELMRDIIAGARTSQKRRMEILSQVEVFLRLSPVGIKLTHKKEP